MSDLLRDWMDGGMNEKELVMLKLWRRNPRQAGLDGGCHFPQQKAGRKLRKNLEGSKEQSEIWKRRM